MDNFDEHLTLPEPLVSIVPPQDLLARIYQQLGEATTGEVALEHSWMRLGAMLLQYKNAGAAQWKKDGFDTFEIFMLGLRDKYNRGRTQLWGYINAAEYFLPTVDSSTLEKIGISKALEMRRQSRLVGKPVPEEIVKVAALQTTTIKELRAMLGAAFNIQDDGPAGTWFDFQGTYYTAEQKAEFKDAVRVAMKVLGLKPNVPDHIARGEIMLAFAKEFFGTHAPEVYGKQQAEPDAETIARYKRLGDHAGLCEQCALFLEPSPCEAGKAILTGQAAEVPAPGDDEMVWVGISVADQRPSEIFRNHKLAMESLHGAAACVIQWPYKSAVEIIRRKVFERDNYTCTNCGDTSLTWASGHMHEKIWRGKGGNISLANGTTLCYTCHILNEEAGHGKRQPQWSKESAAL